MNLKKLLSVSFLINILQILLILVIIVFVNIKPTKDMFVLLYFSAALTAFNSMLSALGYYFAFYKQQQSDMSETVKNLEALNSTLREQRHDYLNHIQVIYGLMELEEYEEAQKYMAPVYRDILKVSKALKTAQPAVNALLQAKMQMAEREGIHLYLEVKSNLKDITMEGWELCKVLSNVIDNGITALQSKEDPRNLYIDISEDEQKYYCYIYNNGPMIEQEQMPHLFDEGYTSKEEEGHGMGLFIAKRILEKESGTIQVSSTEQKTCFTITLGKKKSIK